LAVVFTDLFKSDASFNSILVQYPIPYLGLDTKGAKVISWVITSSNKKMT